MIFGRPLRRNQHMKPSWTGAAFLVEAMLLLVFLIASLAVFTQLFATAAERGAQSGVISSAVMAAENTAERFSADPAHMQAESWEGDLRITCAVSDEKKDGGTLYHATIDVYAADGGDPIYSIATSRYESGVS